MPGAVRRLQAVVLDLDGTMVDSEPTHARANHEYFTATLGFEPDEALYTSMLGRRVRDLTDVVAARTGRDPDEVFAGREAVFWTLLDEGVIPMAGVHAAVTALRSAGLPLAVASSGTTKYVLHCLESLGLEDAFTAVATGEDVTHGKPDPEIYRLAARRLGVDPAACAAIEDAPNGVASAAAAGLRAIAVPNGESEGQSFPGAETVLGDLQSAATYLLAHSANLHSRATI